MNIAVRTSNLIYFEKINNIFNDESALVFMNVASVAEVSEVHDGLTYLRNVGDCVYIYSVQRPRSIVNQCGAV
jgi:hypothetical protein